MLEGGGGEPSALGWRGKGWRICTTTLALADVLMVMEIEIELLSNKNEQKCGVWQLGDNGDAFLFF